MSLRALTKLPVPLLALLSLPPLVHCDCYIASYGLVSKQDWIACPGTATSPGGVQTCCISGSECGDDSICHVLNSPGSNEWYLAGCTDSSYQASVCNNACGAYATVYIEYEDSSQDWMCCGNGGCNGTVTDDTFKAVSPSGWKIISGSSAPSRVASSTSTATRSSSTAERSSPDTASTNAAPTKATTRLSAPGTGTYDFKTSQARTSTTPRVPATAISTATSGSASSDQSQNNSSGLSTGAQAGIGIGIGLAALALIVGLVAIYMLRRSRKSKETNMYAAGDDVREKRETLPPYPPYSSGRSVEGSRMSELPTNPPVYEVGGHENELPSRSWRP